MVYEVAFLAVGGAMRASELAISPLIADLPIDLFVLFRLSNLMKYDPIIRILSFGACYMVYLGIENSRAEIRKAREKLPGTDALGSGIMKLLDSSSLLSWRSIYL